MDKLKQYADRVFAVLDKGVPQWRYLPVEDRNILLRVAYNLVSWGADYTDAYLSELGRAQVEAVDPKLSPLQQED